MILLDVMLPGGSGFDLHRWLKKHDPLKDVPVIFFTGVPTQQGRNQAIELGAVGYLSKASDRAQLSGQIQAAVGMARATATRLVKQGPRQIPPPADGQVQPVWQPG